MTELALEVPLAEDAIELPLGHNTPPEEETVILTTVSGGTTYGDGDFEEVLEYHNSKREVVWAETIDRSHLIDPRID